MPPKKKSVRGAVSSFELCTPFIGIMPPPCCSLFRKNVADRKKTDDDYVFKKRCSSENAEGRFSSKQGGERRQAAMCAAFNG
jgi:hypothetical protein